MRNLSCAIALLATAGTMACSDASGPLTAPGSTPHPTAAVNANTVVARVNTGVHWTIPEDLFGFEVGNVLAVNGRKRADGSVNGAFQYHQSFLGQDLRFSGRVTCLNIYDGNRAKVGGIIEVSNDPDVPAGLFLWWQNIDNGEGAAAPPDQSTVAGFGDEAANEAFCDSAAPPVFIFDVVGNVQVRTD